MARIVDSSSSGLQEAGSWLREGKLVAFPTETVYGLGANALNEASVLSIFSCKGRPLTDPVIVHVTSLDSALQIVRLSPSERIIFSHLGERFWPGPLTIVAPKADHVPMLVTAGTGLVGVRCPSHAIARQMIDEAGVPVAAPSANRFGHVSPTTADHVMSDLGSHPILIVEGGECPVGIESTVLRLDPLVISDSSETEKRSVTILRRGAISPEDISEHLTSCGLSDVQVLVNDNTKASGKTAQVAPGQLLTHYAPDVPAFLVSPSTPSSSSSASASISPSPSSSLAQFNLSECVLIDFGSQFSELSSRVLAYRDLSSSKDPHEAAAALFAALRWAETIQTAQAVLLCDIRAMQQQESSSNDRSSSSSSRKQESVSRSLQLAIFDRMFRAASGRGASIFESLVQINSEAFPRHSD